MTGLSVLFEDYKTAELRVDLLTIHLVELRALKVRSSRLKKMEEKRRDFQLEAQRLENEFKAGLATLEAFRDNFPDIIRRNCAQCSNGLIAKEVITPVKGGVNREYQTWTCPYCTALIEAIEADTDE